MIIVTGAYGFIGSALIGTLNKLGKKEIIAVDDFTQSFKSSNLIGKEIHSKIERDQFIEFFKNTTEKIEVIYHIGARTDTTEQDQEILDKLNLNFTKSIWEICTEKQIPLIYASSAATYGLGEHGYLDNHEVPYLLQPLNKYGISKNEFDKWAIKQTIHPPFWAGLKFFNVYGPNEYHKSRMASVVMHGFNQINQNKEIKLFRSHNPNYKDGEQLRDFIYVKDLIDVILFLNENKPESGLYNLGTGEARSFLALANATFAALNIPSNIQFIDTPIDIRDKYQYYTQADMSKLKLAGYSKSFTSLEEGVKDYVQNYLSKKAYI